MNHLITRVLVGASAVLAGVGFGSPASATTPISPAETWSAPASAADMPDGAVPDGAVPDGPARSGLDGAADDDAAVDGAVDAADDARASRRNPVGIPGHYVYAPSRGALHDYCTMSPNGDGAAADFRGPCARHDLCIAYANDTWSGGANLGRRKSHQMKVCHPNLEKDMRANCDGSYGSWDHRRYTCRTLAVSYHAAVILHTHVVGG